MRIGVGACGWLVCGVLALSACTGTAQAIVTETPEHTGSPEASPSVTEIASATPSPTASASPAPLTDDEILALMPEGANWPDLFGAQVTALFFLEQYGPMVRTGDARAWRSLSTAACEYCVDAVATAEAVSAGQWVVEGGDVVPSDNVEGRFDGERTAWVLVDAVSKESIVLDGSGVVRDETPLQEFTFGLVLDFDGKMWRVTEVGAEESQ